MLRDWSFASTAVEWELQGLADEMAKATTQAALLPLLESIRRIVASANSLENEILRKMDEVSG